MDEDNLELALQFMDITGCAEIATAKEYISFGGGNLQDAIQLFFASSTASTSHDARPVAVPRLEEVRAPIAPRTERLADVMMPTNSLTHSTEISIDSGIMNETYVEPFRNAGTTHTYDNLDVEDSDSEMQIGSGPSNDLLAKMFEPPQEIMYRGTVESARKSCQETKKWLMISIHNPADFQCQVLNRDLWKDKSVVSMMKENFIFLQLGHLSFQGKEHIQFYPFSSYPYIAILDPLTGERVKQWNRTMNPDDFMIEVFEFLSSKEVKKPEVKKKKQKLKSVSMLSEEEQMQLAIKASVEGSTVPEYIEIDSDPEPDIIIPKDPLSIFNSIPTSDALETTLGPELTTRLRFKFPTGKFVNRKFAKNAKIADLFAFLKQTGESKPFEKILTMADECSLLRAFDNLQLCFTVIPQAKHYYRYGKFKDCKQFREEFSFCLSTKGLSPKDAQAIISARNEEKSRLKKEKRPSVEAGIWELR